MLTPGSGKCRCPGRRTTSPRAVDSRNERDAGIGRGGVRGAYRRSDGLQHGRQHGVQRVVSSARTERLAVPPPDQIAAGITTRPDGPLPSKKCLAACGIRPRCCSPPMPPVLECRVAGIGGLIRTQNPVHPIARRSITGNPRNGHGCVMTPPHDATIGSVDAYGACSPRHIHRRRSIGFMTRRARASQSRHRAPRMPYRVFSIAIPGLRY